MPGSPKCRIIWFIAIIGIELVVVDVFNLQLIMLKSIDMKVGVNNRMDFIFLFNEFNQAQGMDMNNNVIDPHD